MAAAATRRIAFITVPATDGDGPLGDKGFTANTVLMFPGGQSGLTAEGGFAHRVLNKTGNASIKGTLVKTSAGTDNAFDLADADGVNVIGVVYEADIADGQLCWIVVSGRAQVKLENNVACTRGNWLRTSAGAAGRADGTGASPAAAPAHFAECGHVLETVGADAAGALAYCTIHFL
jgi:hypothetical protein